MRVNSNPIAYFNTVTRALVGNNQLQGQAFETFAVVSALQSTRVLTLKMSPRAAKPVTQPKIDNCPDVLTRSIITLWVQTGLRFPSFIRIEPDDVAPCQLLGAPGLSITIRQIKGVNKTTARTLR